MQSVRNELAVAASELVKNYQLGSETIRALRGVSFEVEIGSFVSVMGASGSASALLSPVH